MTNVMLLAALLICSSMPPAAGQVASPADHPATPVTSTDSNVDAAKRVWIGKTIERFLSSDDAASA